MTPKMMRSQLAELVKLEIGRVRRRTSRKQRSITLVVRTLRQWACGTAKKLSSSSKSRSRLARARRSPLLGPGAVRRQGFSTIRRLVDRGGFAHARALLLRHLVGDIAQLVRPAALLRDLRVDQGQRRRQAGRAVGDDQPQVTAFEAAQKAVLQEGRPRRF